MALQAVRVMVCRTLERSRAVPIKGYKPGQAISGVVGEPLGPNEEAVETYLKAAMARH